MGRTPCCDRRDVRRGPWSPEEDAALRNYMLENRGNGGSWIALPGRAGLKRCGKSCRLRWMNYLRPGIKRGGFTKEEDKVIRSLYLSVGSRWSIIASRLPGRTDNDIKNYWNTKLKKKLTASFARDISGPKLRITDYNHLTKSSVCSDSTPCQQAENERLSSFGGDTSSEMVSVSVPAADSDFDITNNGSNLASTFGEEEEAFLDFGGSAFFGDLDTWIGCNQL